MLFIILAAAQNGVIGKDGGMPWHIPADLRHFKKLTIGKTLIMGRKTFESLPGVLPGRRHIIATRGAHWNGPPGTETVRDLQAVLEKHADSAEKIFVIGGADVCAQALPYCAAVYLTVIHQDFDGGVRFPAMDGDVFELTGRSETLADPGSGLTYEYQTWKRRLRLVIFDMDGLMFDTERPSIESWKEVGMQMGLTITDRFLQSIVGSNHATLQKLFAEEFGPDNRPDDCPSKFESAVALKKAIVARKLDEEGLIVKEGLFALLTFLKKRGIQRAVGTATATGAAEKLLQRAGAASWMNAVIGGDQAERGKPFPDIFQKVLARFSCPPENALVLEDSPNGLLAAAAAGIPCALVPDTNVSTSASIFADTSVSADARQKAALVAQDLREVMEWIRKNFTKG
ncbi:MAG: HAD-IA family hydrolase [Clostridiales bacterium]|jgi:dihydrofolate reductase|nr:HAD-IA family hydrolase [Clostridiales bacterium]